MNKPVIGITLDYLESGSYSNYPYYSLRCNYASAIDKCGGVPIFLHYEKDLVNNYIEMIDGLLIPGGNFDIAPDLYGEQIASNTVKTNSTRTDFEYNILQAAIENKMPILGVCGGEQLLNVIMGGSLVQDIPEEITTDINHEQDTPKHETSHIVNVKKDSLLFKIMGQENIMVNSTHHQAVKNPGQNIAVSACAPDGVIEAIEIIDYSFGIGVQWHPEYLTSQHDQKLFASFIKAAKDYNNG